FLAPRISDAKEAVNDLEQGNELEQRNELEQAVVPSFEEGALRPTNKCHATLIRAQRGRSDAFLQQASEFPGRVDFDVTSHFLDPRGTPSSKERKSQYSSPPPRLESGMYIVIALSGFCAMAGETVWTRILALLLGGSVYTFAIILAVF